MFQRQKSSDITGNDEFQDKSDDEDEISEYDDVEKAESKRAENSYRVVDNDYEGELGYSLIKSLRGNTVGRRFKRNLFKYGFFQIFCGIALSALTIIEGNSSSILNSTCFTADLVFSK